MLKLDVQATDHEMSPATVLEAIRRFGDNPHGRIYAFDNSGGPGEAVRVADPMSFLESLPSGVQIAEKAHETYTQIREQGYVHDGSRKPLSPDAQRVYDESHAALQGKLEAGRSVSPLDGPGSGSPRPEGSEGDQRLPGLTQTQTPEFKAWFGDSKVVDESGAPLVVTHGAGKAFEVFSPAKMGSQSGLREAREGFWFTGNTLVSDWYAEGQKNPQTYPVFLRMENPLIVNNDMTQENAFKEAKAEGHDGVIFRNTDEGGDRGDTFVVFDPKQIKSAIGNRGTFDPNNPNILFQPEGAESKRGFLRIGPDHNMSDGRPGRRPGTPSPNKKFWVVRIKGGLVRIEGPRIHQYAIGPTPFVDAKSAKNAARLVWVGEMHIVEIIAVTRGWLESVAKGEHPEVKVDTYAVAR